MKKNKSKKVLSIVLLSLVVALGITYIVFYCIKPTQTQTITWQVFDYICTKPLPVIGISGLTLLIILYKIIKFAINHKGIKMSELQKELKQLKEELEKSKEESNKQSEDIKVFINESLDRLDDFNKNLCNLLPNKKIKQLGEETYGKDSKTETKDL